MRQSHRLRVAWAAAANSFWIFGALWFACHSLHPTPKLSHSTVFYLPAVGGGFGFLDQALWPIRRFRHPLTTAFAVSAMWSLPSAVPRWEIVRFGAAALLTSASLVYGSVLRRSWGDTSLDVISWYVREVANATCVLVSVLRTRSRESIN